MGRKQAPEKKALRHRLYTRVNDQKFKQLTDILAREPTLDMSSLIRRILEDRPVKIFTRDMTLDNTMEELSRLRTEIRAIGININQITKLFNTYPEPIKKVAYSRIAFDEYRLLQPKIEAIMVVMQKLSKKWLSE